MKFQVKVFLVLAGLASAAAFMRLGLQSPLRLFQVRLRSPLVVTTRIAAEAGTVIAPVQLSEFINTKVELEIRKSIAEMIKAINDANAATNKKIDDNYAATNKKFDDANAATNKSIEEINKKLVKIESGLSLAKLVAGFFIASISAVLAASLPAILQAFGHAARLVFGWK